MSKKQGSTGRTDVARHTLTLILTLVFVATAAVVHMFVLHPMQAQQQRLQQSHAQTQQLALLLKEHINQQQTQLNALASMPSSAVALLYDDGKWQQTLARLLPSAKQIRLISADNALSVNDALGFVVQDMVSKTLAGKRTRVEAVRRNNAMAFFMAAPIIEERRMQGVLLVEFGQAWLDKLLVSVPDGSLEIQQLIGNDPADGLSIVSRGTLSLDVTPASITDAWIVRFSYPLEAAFPVMLAALWGALVLLILLAGVLLIAAQKTAQQKDVFALLSNLRQLRDKDEMGKRAYSSALIANISNALSIMMKQTQTTAPEATHVAREPVALDDLESRNPPLAHDYQVGAGITVEEEIDTPDVPLSIFRAYDIRGVVGTELTENVCQHIGHAYGSYLQDNGHSEFYLAWDGRLSSPELANAFQKGAQASGCNVVRLGAQPTGLLYFATYTTDISCGVVVTGSHNPAEYNGLKMVMDRQSLSQDDLFELRQRILRHHYRQGNGEAKVADLQSDYLNHMLDDVQLSRTLKVVIDAGNGIAGPCAKYLFEHMGADCIELYCDVDGHFPNHHPDPSIPANQDALKAAVVQHQADLGLAFDGDGDRVFLVDNTGRSIWPDQMLMLLVEDILPRNPGADVVYDVKSSRHLAMNISRYGGRPTMWKTGHSLMKQKINELDAIVGGEFSGHIYIRDRWFGFDDGLYVGARLLEIISAQDISCAEYCDQLPSELSVPEINLPSDDEQKFQIVEAIRKDRSFSQDARMIDIDGVRLDFSDGWCLIRASNTTPTLSLRFAGNDQDAVSRIQQKMRDTLTKHAPNVPLNF